MFDTDQFLSDCIACLEEPEPRRAVRETVERAMSTPSEVASALPPAAAGLSLLYRSDDLTVLNVVWAPGMRIFAHDHRMWACIGIYAGAEDNSFFRRPVGTTRGLIDSGGRRLEVRDAVLLGDDTIHAVANRLGEATGAIHVYGGDFVSQERSQWLEPMLEEEPYDMALVQQEFESANKNWLRE
jgi:predicted metal-dependent enzyme (double-stranded beta helix superfamily)